MALIVPGPLVTVLSGKVGGTVFLNGSTFKAVRSYSKQTRSTSALISDVQSHINSCLAAWRSLSLVEQLEWETSSLRFPRTNRVGQTYYLSGYAFFMSLNLKLKSTGFSIRPVDNVDDLLDVGDYEDILAIPDRINLNFDSDTLPANYVVNCFAAPPGSPGRLRSHISYYKLIQVSDNLAGYTIDITAAYMQTYGIYDLKVNSTIYSYVEFMDSTSGLCTSRQFQSCRVVAH